MMNKTLWVSLTKTIVVFCSLMLMTGSTYADLTSAPPISEATVLSNEAQIDQLITKARAAIHNRYLTAPAKKNAVYFVEKLLTLSPDDKRGRVLLSEVCDTYLELAYKSLKINQIESAQRFHDKAKEIAHKYKIDYDNKMLADLQSEIDLRKLTLRRTKIKHLKSLIEKPAESASTAKDKDNDNQKETNQVTEQQQTKNPKVVIDIPFEKNNPVEEQQTTRQLQQKKASDQFDPEQIVVVVNTQNSLSSITMKDLKSLYKGRQQNWKNGDKVTLYLPPANSKEGLWLARKIFNKRSFSAVQQFYMRQLNRDKINKMPKISRNGVLHVSSVAGGIAIVQAGMVVDREAAIKLLPIQGM